MEWVTEFAAMAFVFCAWVVCFLVIEDTDKKELPAEEPAKLPKPSKVIRKLLRLPEL